MHEAITAVLLLAFVGVSILIVAEAWKNSQVVGVVPVNTPALVWEHDGYVEARIEQAQQIARREMGGTLTLNGETWRAILADHPEGAPVQLYIRDRDIVPTLSEYVASGPKHVGV